MMRVRNEGRWIRRSLERTFEVAKTVVIFDDHSTDATKDEALQAISGCVQLPDRIREIREGASAESLSIHGKQCHLTYRCSPFLDDTDEVRDKNFLWEIVCSFKFRAVLCLDGDEMLSREAIRKFPEALDRLENGGASVIVMPFVYLWDGEDRRRIDGVYNDIRHARLFTVDRAPNYREARFFARGRAGFHCGSIPENLNNGHIGMDMPVIHFGYIDAPLRHKKLAFYTALDPDNEGEGYYKHIVGDPNHLAPGPLRLVEYIDQ